MNKRFSALVMGMLALMGGRLAYSPSAQNSLMAGNSAIHEVSDKDPLYLEKFTEPAKASNSGSMMAWHSSHVSHSSHWSHSSHASHYSHYSSRY